MIVQAVREGFVVSVENARTHLQAYGLAANIQTFAVSSATVELAAAALGVEGARIAKTLSLYAGDKVLLVVCAGDARLHNQKFKFRFSAKPKMLSPEELEEKIGHQMGGVCPFGVKDGVEIYLDQSLLRFETVFPACGEANNAIELTPQRLFEVAKAREWVDVCKIPGEDAAF